MNIKKKLNDINKKIIELNKLLESFKSENNLQELLIKKPKSSKIYLNELLEQILSSCIPLSSSIIKNINNYNLDYQTFRNSILLDETLHFLFEKEVFDITIKILDLKIIDFFGIIINLLSKYLFEIYEVVDNKYNNKISNLSTIQIKYINEKDNLLLLNNISLLLIDKVLASFSYYFELNKNLFNINLNESNYKVIEYSINFSYLLIKKMLINNTFNCLISSVIQQLELKIFKILVYLSQFDSIIYNRLLKLKLRACISNSFNLNNFKFYLKCNYVKNDIITTENNLTINYENIKKIDNVDNINYELIKEINNYNKEKNYLEIYFEKDKNNYSLENLRSSSNNLVDKKNGQDTVKIVHESDNIELFEKLIENITISLKNYYETIKNFDYSNYIAEIKTLDINYYNELKLNYNKIKPYELHNLLFLDVKEYFIYLNELLSITFSSELKYYSVDYIFVNFLNEYVIKDILNKHDLISSIKLNYNDKTNSNDIKKSKIDGLNKFKNIIKFLQIFINKDIKRSLFKELLFRFLFDTLDKNFYSNFVKNFCSNEDEFANKIYNDNNKNDTNKNNNSENNNKLLHIIIDIINYKEYDSNNNNNNNLKNIIDKSSNSSKKTSRFSLNFDFFSKEKLLNYNENLDTLYNKELIELKYNLQILINMTIKQNSIIFLRELIFPFLFNLLIYNTNLNCKTVENNTSICDINNISNLKTDNVINTSMSETVYNNCIEIKDLHYIVQYLVKRYVINNGEDKSIKDHENSYFNLSKLVVSFSTKLLYYNYSDFERDIDSSITRYTNYNHDLFDFAIQNNKIKTIENSENSFININNQSILYGKEIIKTDILDKIKLNKVNKLKSFNKYYNKIEDFDILDINKNNYMSPINTKYKESFSNNKNLLLTKESIINDLNKSPKDNSINNISLNITKSSYRKQNNNNNSYSYCLKSVFDNIPNFEDYSYSNTDDIFIKIINIKENHLKFNLITSYFKKLLEFSTNSVIENTILLDFVKAFYFVPKLNNNLSKELFCNNLNSKLNNSNCEIDIEYLLNSNIYKSYLDLCYNDNNDCIYYGVSVLYLINKIKNNLEQYYEKNIEISYNDLHEIIKLRKKCDFDKFNNISSKYKEILTVNNTNFVDNLILYNDFAIDVLGSFIAFNFYNKISNFYTEILCLENVKI